MDIFDVVEGRAGLQGVQWALLDDAPREVLQRVLSSLLPPNASVGPLLITRAKYKPGRYLQTYYDVCVVKDDGTSVVCSTEAVWLPRDAGDPRGDAAAREAMEAEALERGQVIPWRKLSAEEPGWGLWVQVAPLDARYPQLARAYDPRYVREMLAAAGVASEDDVPYYVTSVRYRPGQRHVLRYTPAEPDGRNVVYAKLYNSDKGALVSSTAQAVAGSIEAPEGVAVARPLAYLPADCAVLYPHIAGVPLSRLFQRPPAEFSARLHTAGACLLALHRLSGQDIALKPHSFAQELRSISSASEHIRSLLPPVAEAIDRVLGRARLLYAELEQEPPSFAYGDFKADHLLCTATGMTVIDCDTCYLADPAIDVGKFLADIDWWYDVYGNEGVDVVQEQFLAGYSPLLSPARLLRARLYEALVLVKSTVRRVPLFDPGWAQRTERLIRRAEMLLGQLEQQAAARS